MYHFETMELAELQTMYPDVPVELLLRWFGVGCN